MKDSNNKLVLLLFGNLTCLAFTSIVNADGKFIFLNISRFANINFYSNNFDMNIYTFPFPSVKLRFYNTFSYY